MTTRPLCSDVHKDGVTLAQVLDKDEFTGTLFSDAVRAQPSRFGQRPISVSCSTRPMQGVN